MRRREFIGFISAGTVGWPLVARAQQPDRMRSVGVLINRVEGDPAGQSQLVAFRDGLAKLGWTDANLRLEIRWGSNPTLIERYALELVALGPDILVGESTATLRAFQLQTKTLPIVFLGVADPIGQGFVANLAHPGGNITGFSVFDAPMAGKWLEMMTQITPPVTRVAVLFDPATTPYAGLMLQACEDAIKSIALAVRAAPVNNDSEVEIMMAGIAHEERGGVLVFGSAFTVSHHDTIVATANKYRVPAVYGNALFARSGGLMAYGSDLVDQYRRAADDVDHILKGNKPGDLPVQQPSKFELVINLKTAKALGITIAPSLLGLADEVIE
jgi:putative tryptophan/tyrosine transport system substrate-binding protein